MGRRACTRIVSRSVSNGKSGMSLIEATYYANMLATYYANMLGIIEIVAALILVIRILSQSLPAESTFHILNSRSCWASAVPVGKLQV